MIASRNDHAAANLAGDHEQPRLIDDQGGIDGDRLHALRPRHVENCWEEEEPPPDGMPLFQLADLLQMHLPLSAEKRYEIFSTRPLEQRIRDVLNEAGREKN